MKKKTVSILITLTSLLTIGCTNSERTNKEDLSISISEEEDDGYQAISSSMVVNGYEWGPAVDKVIVEFDGRVKNFAIDTFQVKTATDIRKIKDVYNSDDRGNRVDKESKFIAFDLEVKYNFSSPFYYDWQIQQNRWVDSYKLTLTLREGKSFTVGKTEYNDVNSFRFVDDLLYSIIKDECDAFYKDEYTYKDQTLQRAIFTPNGAKADKSKNPLIIWLHGLGEGGKDIDIDLLGNEVTALTRTPIQNYFTTDTQSGAYVLAMQTNTCWMDDGTGKMGYKGSLSDGQPSIYTDALYNGIKDIVDNNADIDPKRIYIGGCSNGGYMTMEMMFNYGDYFAAYYPICEAYMNRNISDSKIDQIKDYNIWFIQSERDDTINSKESTIPTFYRTIANGASNTHFTLKDTVTGKDDPNATYSTHWSWTYFFNDDIKTEFDNDKVKEDYRNIRIENGKITSENNFVTYANCNIEGNIFSWLSNQCL